MTIVGNIISALTYRPPIQAYNKKHILNINIFEFGLRWSILVPGLTETWRVLIPGLGRRWPILVPGWAETWPVLGPVMLLGGVVRVTSAFSQKHWKLLLQLSPVTNLSKAVVYSCRRVYNMRQYTQNLLVVLSDYSGKSI